MPALRHMLVSFAVGLVALVGAAGAGAEIQVLSMRAYIDTMSLTPDPYGNVYVLNEFQGLLKFGPDGARTPIHFTSPVAQVEGARTSSGLIWGPDDKLWFTCDYVICHIDPDTGATIDTPASYPSTGGGPPPPRWTVDRTARTVTREGPDGRLTTFQGLPPGGSDGADPMGDDHDGAWLTFGAYLVHVLSSGTIDAFPLPSGLSAQQKLMRGLDGNLWLFDVGHLTRLTETGRLLGQSPVSALPNEFVRGPDGDLWFSTFTLDGGVGRITPSGRVSEFANRIAYAAYVKHIVLAADGGIWVDSSRDAGIWRLYPDPPATSTDAATGVGIRSAALHATVNPNGGPTTAYFEYGTTGGYGTRTTTEDLGDGEDPLIVSARLDGLAPSTTYHYRVVVVNGTRTVRGADRTVRTADAPSAPPPAGELPKSAPLDADGDGYPADIDCDDHVASVRPGAVDRPGDTVDQDCSGGPAPWDHLAPPIDARWATHRASTTFTRLTLGALPAKATVSLACAGGGCAFKSYTLKTRRATKRTDLLVRLKRSRLRRGAQITLRLAATGQATTVVRWRIGPPTRRTMACVAPGVRAETSCA